MIAADQVRVVATGVVRSIAGGDREKRRAVLVPMRFDLSHQQREAANMPVVFSRRDRAFEEDPLHLADDLDRGRQHVAGTPLGPNELRGGFAGPNLFPQASDLDIDGPVVNLVVVQS